MIPSADFAEELIDELNALLAEKEPNEIGFALASVTARHLCCFAPTLREDILKLHVETVRNVLQVEDIRLREAGVYPKGWSQQ